MNQNYIYITLITTFSVNVRSYDETFFFMPHISNINFNVFIIAISCSRIINLAIISHKELVQIDGHVVKRLALWRLLTISEGKSGRKLVSTPCCAALRLSTVVVLVLSL